MSDQKDDGPAPSGLLERVAALVERSIFQVPASWREVVWRVISIFSVSVTVVSGYIGWRHPEILKQIIPPGIMSVEERMARDPATTREVMAMLSSYLRSYSPDRLAIISWPSRMATRVVWSSGDVAEWPTPLGGTMDSELVPAVGRLHFGECWTGRLDSGTSLWTLCPISSDLQPRGFLLAHWNDQADAAAGASQLRFLARRIEAALY